jgi:hypothetical protein
MQTLVEVWLDGDLMDRDGWDEVPVVGDRIHRLDNKRYYVVMRRCWVDLTTPMPDVAHRYAQLFVLEDK